jgi:DNA invertase Pin-like site-specific DNA recombinase/peptidoglycan hydrolase-like protein with peptidoglycan-binding domain
MYPICSAPWARRWPAGLIAAALAGLTAPAALGATSTQDGTLTVSAGWHGREIRDPQPGRTIDTATAWPHGWSAGAVRLGAGSVRADGSRRVREVQRRLWRRGYRPGPVDGRFGRRTRSALVWFQLKHGLARTGTVDVHTLAAVRSGRSDARRASTRWFAMAPAVAAAAPASAGRTATDLTAIILLLLVMLLGLAVIAAWIRSATRARVTATAPPDRAAGRLAVADAPRQPRSAPGADHVPASPGRARSERPDPAALATGAWCAPPAPAGLAGLSRAPEPPTSPPAPVLGYLTVARGASDLQAGARTIGAWCERRGWSLAKVVHDVEPTSGRLSDRPGLAYALGQIADGHACGIVVCRLGDLTGSVTELAALLRWLVDVEALVIALDFELDSSTAAGTAALRALIQVADGERDRIDDRTRRAPAAVGSRSGRVGRPAVRDDPELSSRIAAMRSRGMSLQAIADALNADGVPTLRGGSHWRPSSVQAATGYKRPPGRPGGILLPPLRRASNPEPRERPKEDAA